LREKGYAIKKILCIFSLLSILAPSIASAEEYSLAELYNLALERSIALKRNTF